MPSEAYENLVTMLSGGRVTPELPIEAARSGWDAMETLLPSAPDVKAEDVELAALHTRVFTGGPDRATVLHLHGGGYVIGSARSHTPFASHLAAAVGGRVVVPEYRLAPEHPAPAAIEDAVAAYRALLDGGTDPADITVTGDSAGGGLAIATVAALRDRDVALPAGVSVVSPFTDLTLDDESMRTKVDEDIVLSPELLTFWGGLYANGLPLDDPRLSPVFGDLSGLPPLHIQVGTREVLLDDARRLADRASAAGVDVDLLVCDEMIHIWPVLGAGLVPEAQEAIDRIAAFARRSPAA